MELFAVDASVPVPICLREGAVCLLADRRERLGHASPARENDAGQQQHERAYAESPVADRAAALGHRG